MKTGITSASLPYQQANDPTLLKEIAFYEQSDTPIDSISGGTSIVLTGNLTSFFSQGDIIICPFYKFELELTITSVTYSVLNGETTITISGGTLTSDAEGKFLARRITVTDYILEQGVTGLKQAIEGETMFRFDSGYMDIPLSNVNGYFAKRDKTGLLNSGNVFWVKLFLKFKGSSDNDIIYFGGTLDLTDFDINMYEKTVTVRAYGHSYEVDRYPGYYLTSTETKYMPKISGMEVLNFIPNDNSGEGIKRLVYKPFNSNSRMNGVKVLRVSEDVQFGIKQIIFRYPYYFRWDSGTEYIIGSVGDTDASSGTKLMYGQGGSAYADHAVLEFGNSSGLNEYPDDDDVMWAYVERAENINDDTYTSFSHVQTDVSQQGRPTLTFDNGEDTTIWMKFTRYFGVTSGGTYTDATSYMMRPFGHYFIWSPFTFMSANNDYILLVLPVRFWKIAVKFYSSLGASGAIDVQYSRGGDTWSSAMTSGTNGLVDGTSGFEQDGYIEWDECNGWVENDLVTSGGQNLKGFMIKITRTAASASSCTIWEIRNVQRIYGAGGDYIEVDYNQLLLRPEDAEQEIVIKNNNGVWSVGVWYSNVSIQQVLSETTELSNFIQTVGGRSILDDMIISSAGYGFNIWGRPPNPTFPREPEAIEVDWTNEFVVCANTGYIWKCDFDGVWEFVCRLPDEHFRESEYVHAIDIIIASSTQIYVLYGERYHRSTHQFEIQCWGVNLSTGVATKTTAGWYVLGSLGSAWVRDGEELLESGYYTRQIGRDATAIDRGENLCISHRQVCQTGPNDITYLPTLYPTLSLYANRTNFPTWYFHHTYRGSTVLSASNSGPFHVANSGYYSMHMNASNTYRKDSLAFQFQFGQAGSYYKDLDNDTFAIWARQATASGYMWCLWDMRNGNYYGPQYHSQICATANGSSPYGAAGTPNSIAYDSTNDEWYFAAMTWIDTGNGATTGTRSMSYISRFKQDYTNTAIANWTKVFHYDGSIYTDLTATANGGGSLSPYYLNSIGDIYYLGYSKRFRSWYAPPATAYAIAIMEYWDGSSWVECKNHNINNGSDYTSFASSCMSHEPMPDWATTTVNGQSAYWIRIRSTGAPGNHYLSKCLLSEEVLWDSSGTSADYYRSIVNIEYNPTDDTVVGCYYNRDEGSSTEPNEWRLFVYDCTNDVFETNVVAGTGVTYDGGRIFKNFTYQPNGHYVYAISENARYKDTPAELLTIGYSYIASTVSVTLNGVPDDDEWGTSYEGRLPIKPSNDAVFAITKGAKNFLWEYNTSYYPRIEHNSMSESDTMMDVLSNIAQVMNCYMIIHSERVIRFVLRGETNGTSTFYWDKNFSQSKPKFNYWKEYYDAVIVSYDSQFYDSRGTEKQGFDGWKKKVMSISNPFIQNRWVAKYVAENLYNYFNNYRIEATGIKVNSMIELECIDQFNIVIPERMLDIDEDVNFLITEIVLRSDDSLLIKGIEIIEGIG